MLRRLRALPPLLAPFVFGAASVLAAGVTPRLASLLEPGPAAAWRPALQGFSQWAGGREGARLLEGDRAWERLAERLGPEPAPEQLAALEPLARVLESRLEEVPQLRWEIENIDALRPKDQRRVIALLQEARGQAAEELKEAYREFNRAEPEEGEAEPALDDRIARLDDFRRRLNAVDGLKLYGRPSSLAKAQDGLRERLRNLRTAWVTMRVDMDADSLGTPLSRFLLDFHRDLIAARPDLYRMKLEKAARSDFDFFRAFPQLHYDFLKAQPEAAQLRRAPELILDGDAHPENVLLVERKLQLTPQFVDFDDSARGPASLDLARMLTGIAVLGKGGAKEAARLIQIALDSYVEGLGTKFKAWASRVAREKAVLSAKPRDRDWARHAGIPVRDEEKSAAVREATGHPSREWEVFDRRGAGESSIGVLRYMFTRAKRRHVRELKQLRAPAVSYFLQEPSDEGTHRERLARAYAAWRKVREEALPLAWGESDWLLRRREAHETGLSFGDLESVARVMGGLVAQGHRSQGVDLELLREAALRFPARLVSAYQDEIARMRKELKRMLRDGR